MLIFLSPPKSLRKIYVFIRPNSRPLVSMKCDTTLPKVGKLVSFFFFGLGFFLVNIFLIIFKMIFIR